MPKPTMEPISSITGTAAQEGMLVQLALDQITLDPNTDVRTGPTAKDEAAKIDALARSMYEQGQLQPVVVRPNGKEGTYLLVAGRRRYAAKQVIASRTNEAVTIDALVVSKTDEEAWAASLQENLQRRQFSPIELAHNIVEIRKRKRWDGEDWSKHVADFLHVSRATVTQHAKLLDLPADIRSKVHKGDLSAQSAFDLYSVEESKRAQVLADAEKLAEEEAVEEAAKPRKGKAEAKGKQTEETEKAKIKHRHVLEAARKSDALTQVKPLTRGEILAFFQGILDSTDPYPDAIIEFCKTLVNRWASGYIGDRALMNKLHVIVDMIGDKPAVNDKPVKAKKAVRQGAAA